ncbi:MAG: hypothetical protein OXI24_12240 [Candidatus Poribacteria bacterium]|nr:hypothetical protein [Candidatus Poribacteria bacterium]
MATSDMTFEVEVSGLNHHLQDLLLDRIIETIKDFGVEEKDFRIFLDDDDNDEVDTDDTE